MRLYMTREKSLTIESSIHKLSDHCGVNTNILTLHKWPKFVHVIRRNQKKDYCLVPANLQGSFMTCDLYMHSQGPLWPN